MTVKPGGQLPEGWGKGGSRNKKKLLAFLVLEYDGRRKNGVGEKQSEPDWGLCPSFQISELGLGGGGEAGGVRITLRKEGTFCLRVYLDSGAPQCSDAASTVLWWPRQPVQRQKEKWGLRFLIFVFNPQWGYFSPLIFRAYGLIPVLWELAQKLEVTMAGQDDRPLSRE